MKVAADGPDWGDVLRRSRRSRRRRGTVQLAVVLGLAAAAIASAYALGHPVIDFGTAPRAGLRQVNDFGSMQVAAPRGMAPGVLPHETRRITSIRIDGKLHTLYVAPTRRGGFCFGWSGFGGGCRPSRHGPAAAELDTGGLMGNWGLEVLQGSFFLRGDRLVMRFRDGGSVDVPFVWVTAPIDAGFALFRVPDAHRTASTRPVELELYDGARLVRRDPIPAPTRPFSSGVVHVRGIPPLPLPVGGIWARRRLLFDLREENGQRVALWEMPKRGGGECYVTNNSSGCRQASLPRGFQVALGFGAGDYLCCLVARRVVRVDARFQDGDRVALYPKDGYLVWPIPREHWPLGHRLVALVGYDAAGRTVGRAQVPAPVDQRGIYPCTKPKNLGYGVSMCP